ncbi:hypothetical protein [Streptomyces sp. CHB9.2]|uniref:hypothetical protein n=1 Tax=Streptomyces sp. CHB9.2 TaxID=2841670 RepID=UPI0020945A54|nr:hypothetical protein [Streptomyces sp. CHB9.2]MCO6704685.1 hypothetical protein [Streptomyces sp. CHB9.2]
MENIMRPEARLLIQALIYNHENNLQFGNASGYTIVNVDEHPPFAIAHSANGFKVKLAMDHQSQLRREPLPPRHIMDLVRSLQIYTIDQLRKIIETTPTGWPKLSQHVGAGGVRRGEMSFISSQSSEMKDMVATLYSQFLRTDPAEEVVVKGGEIYIMGWTVEEFVRLCPMRFTPALEERKFIQGLVDALNEAVQQITRGRGYPRGGPSRISIQVSHAHRLLTAVSRLPGIDINPKSRH